MVVVGLYVFVGNSGLLSFGHISFMCLGAYMTGLADHPADDEIGHAQRAARPGSCTRNCRCGSPRRFRACLRRLFALIVGRVIMRLSGIAASIATFGLLGVVNNVYSNWDSVTGRARLHRRHPAQHECLDRIAGRRGRHRDRLPLFDFPLRPGAARHPRRGGRRQRLRNRHGPRAADRLCRQRLHHRSCRRALCALPEHRQSGLVLSANDLHHPVDAGGWRDEQPQRRGLRRGGDFQR